MLPREKSLSSGQQIDYILKNGKRIYSRFFAVTVLPIREGETARMLVMLSKKTSKLATKRNLIRRRCQSLYLSQKKEIAGYHFIMLPKPTVAVEDFQGLREDFNKIIQQI